MLADAHQPHVISQSESQPGYADFDPPRADHDDDVCERAVGFPGKPMNDQKAETPSDAKTGELSRTCVRCC